MLYGFNTNVQVGAVVYHVQTEDRGPARAMVETFVFHKGRVLHRRVFSYRDSQQQPGWDEEQLRWRVEEQHGAVIEELRDGTLSFVAPAPPTPAGVAVQLLNPASWVAPATRTAQLEIQVRSRPHGQPVANADVQVTLQGGQGPLVFVVRTDAQGRAAVSFPLPQVGPGGTELVIRAAGPFGQDEIRYALRARPKPSA